MKPIDAVVTWVDGNDPVHREKRRRFGAEPLSRFEDVAAETRFNSLGEIFWCIASLNVFAPFLRKIYLVTDEQSPDLDGFLDRKFPDGHIPVEIIDHKTIFQGYEQYLPTFDSVSIETLTWRIPGLSERYIELNDDYMLCRPTRPEDFFSEDGKVVCYARKISLWWTRLTRRIKSRKAGRAKVTFKGLMMNAAKLAGQKVWFLRLDHAPKALLRSFYERYYAAHPEAVVRNIRHRFRNPDQYTPEELQYLLHLRNGCCRLLPNKGNLFFLQPKDKPDYVSRKLAKLRNDRTCKFCCFNSIDLASEEERRAVQSWIEERLGLTFE